MDKQQKDWVLANLDHTFQEMRTGLVDESNFSLFDIEPAVLLESIGTLGNNAVSQVLNSPFDSNVWEDSAAQARDIMIFAFLLAVQMQHRAKILAGVSSNMHPNRSNLEVNESNKENQVSVQSVETPPGAVKQSNDRAIRRGKKKQTQTVMGGGTETMSGIAELPAFPPPIT